MSKEDFDKNPQYRNKNPKMGGYNLAEKFDLKFIEENPVIQDCMSKVLGPEARHSQEVRVLNRVLTWT